MVAVSGHPTLQRHDTVCEPSRNPPKWNSGMGDGPENISCRANHVQLRFRLAAEAHLRAERSILKESTFEAE
jgi:hypothetical protein